MRLRPGTQAFGPCVSLGAIRISGPLRIVQARGAIDAVGLFTCLQDVYMQAGHHRREIRVRPGEEDVARPPAYAAGGRAGDLRPGQRAALGCRPEPWRQIDHPQKGSTVVTQESRSWP